MAIVVLVTIPEDKAKSLAELLLKAKVCACVNIIPAVRSYFWWEGKIDQANEAILMIKTRDELFLKVKKVVKDNHPYTVPEIIAVKISKINSEYLGWLESVC